MTITIIAKRQDMLDRDGTFITAHVYEDTPLLSALEHLFITSANNIIDVQTFSSNYAVDFTPKGNRS